MRTIVDRERDSNSEQYSQLKGEGITYAINFDRVMTDRGTSVSSASITSVNGNATVANQSLTSNIAQADITTDRDGVALIKVEATQADGNKRIRYIVINCIDKETSTKDYC